MAAALAIASTIASPDPATAVESATGFYLLGTKGSLAGVTPPPGVYLTDYKYYFSGNTSKTLLINGALVADLDAQAYVDMPTLLWVAPEKILGGNVGVGVIVPVGWKKVDAGLELNLPPPIGTVIRRDFGGSDTNFGDPVPTALIGWQSGNWHWNLQGLLNVPIGFWERRNLSNIGFNRWAFDLTGAITWLDMQAGWETSASAGFTFNGENLDTDYKSGTEFHVEAAIVKNFSKNFGIGVQGYHYQQVTGDSGEAARLGDFKGRVSGIGPVLNYNFEVGRIPISTSWRYFREFDAENRIQNGNIGLVSITIPLWVPTSQSSGTASQPGHQSPPTTGAAPQR